MIFRPKAGKAVKLKRGTKVKVRSFTFGVRPIYGEIVRPLKNSLDEAHIIISKGIQFTAPLFLIEEV